MKIEIKKLGLNSEIHKGGMELGVYFRNKFKGDLYITQTGLIWCPGKTAKKNGKKISWTDFITLMARKRP